ncbi:hypothetical protein B0H66DRAFT_486185 [Apodospora peruviana]|uniref:FAD-binding domain-containing protein n=1 Tax=Apodospora peruviana TaxID=516989 RepID=A0AAE0LYG1_9PEZI|nr:hypothetical protein B0H66DRAFT_486185 [Apodospora peruviana]
MGAATNNNTTDHNGGLHVAIIGAGITGINLALGLQARNIRYTIYERAPGFREIGAGIGFSPNAERAMGVLNADDVLAAYKRVANPNGEDYFQWLDGRHSDSLLFKLYCGKDGFQGCRRSDILEEWAKRVPASCVQFGKQVDSVADGKDNHDDGGGGVVITFTDGTTARAEAVVGCDGIRSRIRQIVLSSPDDKSAIAAQHPHYSNKFCFRALVPMSRAVKALGPYRAGTRFMYNGPDAHIITYPIGNNTVLNVLAVISDPDPWLDSKKHTTNGSKREALAAFGAWHPTVRKIVDLLPDEMEKWAIFDMAEHPAPTYVRGRVCVAGDAAHASGPHLGAGGGMGIEDALVLSALFEAVAQEASANKTVEKRKLIEAALVAYNDVRYGRTQEVVQATRTACDLFQWQEPAVGSDGEKFGREITRLFHRIWEYDVNGMVREAVDGLRGRTGTNCASGR